MLTAEEANCRPLRLRDGPTWVELRLANEAWLRPWEATPAELLAGGRSWAERHTLVAYSSMLRILRRQARQGTHLPFAITAQGRLVGQVTVGQITRGAVNSGSLGYWVDQQMAGRGVAPAAIAVVADHCFGVGGLHRLEADVRPENTASRRVMDKLGFTEEGLRRRLLAIDGVYRDHIGYALLTEDAPQGVLARYRATVRNTPPRGA